MFWRANRARRYLQGGMESGPVPLPLSVKEISAVVEAYDSPLDRELLDTAVFAIDAKFLDSVKPKKQSKQDVGKAWGSFVSMVNAE